jgi:hypothetical protein
MKAKLLKKLRKQVFKIIKLEMNNNGYYLVRGYPELIKDTYKKPPYYLTECGGWTTFKESDYRHNPIFSTASFDEAKSILYSERRRAILHKITIMRNAERDKINKQAVEYQNKQLAKL